MGNQYQRQDVSNNIANGNIINADDLDAEFNALEGAFAAGSGHTHDGTAGEGGPITVVGPAQDVIVSATAVLPKTDNTLDLGSSSFEYKDLWIDGTANIDSLVADTADINGGTVDNTVIGGATPAAGTFTSLVATTADINAGTVDNTVIGGATPAAGTFTSLVATTADINGGTVDGTVIGGATPAAGTFTALTATSGVVTNNSTSPALQITQTGTGAALLVEDSASPDATPFMVSAAGDVGIGISPPNYANFANLALNGASGGTMEYYVNGTLVADTFTDSSGAFYLGTRGADSLYLRTSNTDRVEVDASGNVGIGTSISTIAGYTTLSLGNTVDGGSLRMRNNSTTVAVFNNTSSTAFVGTVTSAQMRLGSGNLTRINIDGTTGNVAINNSTTAANAVAALEIGGTTKGVLLPRLSTSQRDAIAAPPTGLLVYNTTTNQLEYFNGAAWASVGFIFSNITTAEIAPSTLVTASEGVASNDNDTTLPTSAAVKAYAETAAATFSPVKAWVNFNGVPLNGTYSRTGTLVTVTMTAHGMSTGMKADLNFTTGTATDGSYIVTVVDANTFTVVDSASGATSGNVTRNTYIRASYNVSSITDNNTGDYTINFTTAMPDANYATVATSSSTAGNNNSVGISPSAAPTTSAVRLLCIFGSSASDREYVNVTIFR